MAWAVDDLTVDIDNAITTRPPAGRIVALDFDTPGRSNVDFTDYVATP
jgi:hypothetical protein